MQLVGAARAAGERFDSSTGRPEQRFEQLFRAHSRPVLAYALRRVERPEDAADALSEVMLVAWRRIDDVPGGDEARFWLLGVAQRVLSNQSRTSNRRSRLGERLRQQVAAATCDDLAAAEETRSTVRAALRELSESDREILLLTAWEGLDPSQVAIVMEITPSSARTRLHRARARLRQQLGELGVERGGQPVRGDSGGRRPAALNEE